MEACRTSVNVRRLKGTQTCRKLPFGGGSNSAVVGGTHGEDVGKYAMNRAWSSDYKIESLTLEVYRVYRKGASMFVKFLYVAISLFVDVETCL